MRIAVLALMLLMGCSVPAGAPFTTEPPISVSGSRNGRSAPVEIRGGNYRVDWSLNDERQTNLGACGYGARLKSTTNPRIDHSLGSGQAVRGQLTATGTTYVYNVVAGPYYLDVLADCDWTFVLTKQ